MLIGSQWEGGSRSAVRILFAYIIFPHYGLAPSPPTPNWIPRETGRNIWGLGGSEGGVGIGEYRPHFAPRKAVKAPLHKACISCVSCLRPFLESRKYVVTFQAVKLMRRDEVGSSVVHSQGRARARTLSNSSEGEGQTDADMRRGRSRFALSFSAIRRSDAYAAFSPATSSSCRVTWCGRGMSLSRRPRQRKSKCLTYGDVYCHIHYCHSLVCAQPGPASRSVGGTEGSEREII